MVSHLRDDIRRSRYARHPTPTLEYQLENRALDFYTANHLSATDNPNNFEAMRLWLACGATLDLLSIAIGHGIF